MAQTGTNFSILGRPKKVSQLHSEAMTSLNRVVLFADDTFLGSTKPYESLCNYVCTAMQTVSGHLLTLKYCKRMAKKAQTGHILGQRKGLGIFLGVRSGKRLVTDIAGLRCRMDMLGF